MSVPFMSHPRNDNPEIITCTYVLIVNSSRKERYRKILWPIPADASEIRETLTVQQINDLCI